MDMYLVLPVYDIDSDMINGRPVRWAHQDKACMEFSPSSERPLDEVYVLFSWGGTVAGRGYAIRCIWGCQQVGTSRTRHRLTGGAPPGAVGGWEHTRAEKSRDWCAAPKQLRAAKVRMTVGLPPI